MCIIVYSNISKAAATMQNACSTSNNDTIHSYPFGMGMPTRSWSAAGENYRFGFNGQLQVDEVSGEGNHNTALFWEYDTRLGRRWNVDPVVKPWEAPYVAFNDNPIRIIDPSGNDGYVDEDGNFLGDDKDKKNHNTRVINKDKWNETLGDTKPEDISDEMRKSLQTNVTMNDKGEETGGTSKLLNEYEKGIHITDETWATLEKNGGERLDPWVRNNSDKSAYYKPEGIEEGVNYNPYVFHDKAYEIKPKTDLYSPVDGVATKLNSDMVYKVSTGKQLHIHKNGTIDTYSSSIKELGGYFLHDGWKDKEWVEKHRDWQDLLDKASLINK